MHILKSKLFSTLFFSVLSGSLVLQSVAASASPFLPGDVIVSGTGSEGTGLTHIDSTTGDQTLISSGSFSDFALADNKSIYAIESGNVVRIDIATGTKTTVSSGGQLVDPSGIAVDRFGQIQVLDYGSAGGSGAIVQINPTTGGQTILTSGGLLAGNPGKHSDLEISPLGDLIVLDAIPFYPSGNLGEVFAVDITNGQQELLYDDWVDSPGNAEFLYQGTGLGIAPNGDIYVSNGTFHATGVLKIDAVTGEAENAGSIRSCCVLGSDGNYYPFELSNTDMAFGKDGSIWMVGVTGHGLFRWDGSPLIEDSGRPFSEGYFHEVQVVRAATQVPEPGSVLLFAVGFLVIGASAFKRTSRDGL